MNTEMYDKITGEMNWLGQTSHPDLCSINLNISRKSNSETISDLKWINVVFGKGQTKREQDTLLSD